MHHLVYYSKQLKQMIQIERNIAKNPNWLEASQLAAEKQIQVLVRTRRNQDHWIASLML